MKLKKSSEIEFIYSILSISYGAAIAATFVWVFLTIYFIIRGTHLASPYGLSVNILMTHNQILSDLSKNVYLSSLSGKLLIFNPSIMIQLYSGLYTIVIWGCISYILFLIRKIIWSVKNGNPFEKNNSKRLKTIAIIFIAAPWILQFSSSLIVSSLIKTINFENVTLYTGSINEIVYIGAFTGILLYVLAEALRIGTEIKEESELTV